MVRIRFPLNNISDADPYQKSRWTGQISRRKYHMYIDNHTNIWIDRKSDKKALLLSYTICPRSSDPFYIVSYYIKWVTTFWTYSKSKCNLIRIKKKIISHHLCTKYAWFLYRDTCIYINSIYLIYLALSYGQFCIVLAIS